MPKVLTKPKPRFAWLGWSCVVATLALIALFATPSILRINRIVVLQETKSNARSFGLALFEFDKEYNSFPNDSTAAKISEKSPTGFDLSGNTANAAFRQLMAAQITQSETIFYAKIPGSTKPDGIISPGEALKKGECGFAYIAGLNSKDDPNTPLALTPIIPGSSTTFDPKPFSGKAVVLFTDNSVRIFHIHEDGHIYDKGINLLSPEHPFWKGTTPDIRYPELPTPKKPNVLQKLFSN